VKLCARLESTQSEPFYFDVSIQLILTFKKRELVWPMKNFVCVRFAREKVNFIQIKFSDSLKQEDMYANFK